MLKQEVKAMMKIEPSAISEADIRSRLTGSRALVAKLLLRSVDTRRPSHRGIVVW